MKFRYLFLAILVVVAYYCRSFFPMMFFGDEGIEVEFNVPENIVPSAGGDYESSDCQTITFSDGSWINSRRGHDFKMEKISNTKYRTKINYRDYSLCSWRIRSLGWVLHYQDASSVVSGVTGGSGGGLSINIVYKSQLTPDKINSPFYYEKEAFTIDQKLHPEVYAKKFNPNEKRLYIGTEDKYTRNEIYFNPYRHRETAKIIYNVTVDESKVRGLTAEQVLANQEKERVEAQEQ